MATADDRREFQRLKLAKPLLASLDGKSALILDIGLTGAFVEHQGEVKRGQRVRLSFVWQTATVEFVGEVIRSDVLHPPGQEEGPLVSHSGVHFVEPVRDAAKRLQDMMATFVGKVLAAQRANAAPGAPSGEGAILTQLGEARRSRASGYLAYLWDGSNWTCRRTRVADQPRNGFTVAGHEDAEELEELCRTYERADEEGRRLIRLVAELSVKSAKT